MTQEKLEEKLKKLIFEKDKPFVVSISGEWGVGKTYFLQKFFIEKYKEELAKKQIAYISLFGQESLNEIKTNIVLQISKPQKLLNSFKEKIKNIKGTVFKGDDINLSLDGGSVAALLSLFTSNDFKDVIICFDDFERLSSKIDLKDIMGLMSYLKEQKNCKILLILNEKELEKLSDIDKKKHSEIFALYKEKIVDYDFVYSVDIVNLFDTVYRNLENKEHIKDFFEEYKITNIRVGKQIIELFEEFNPVFLNDKIHNKVKRDFIFVALSCFVFKVKFGLDFDGFSNARKYYFDNLVEKKYSDEKIDEQIVYLYGSNDSYEDIAWNYIVTSEFNEEYLFGLLEQNSQEVEYIEQKDLVHSSWNKLHIDFSYKIEDFIKLVKPILKSENINKILTISDFHYYKEFIEKYDNIADFDVDCIIKKYIDDLILREKSIRMHERHNLKIIDEHYSNLIIYRENRRKELLLDLSNNKLIAETLEKSINGWGEKDQYILNNTKVEKYKEIILENQSFVIDIEDFIKKGDEDNYFSQAIKNIKQALQELANENEDYKFKVEKILK